MDLDSRSGGCHVMDLGWCVSCDGFGVGQEDVMWWIWGGVCHVMDLGWVRRMSCDGLELEAEDADWI